jgi:tetratricopeptide (TPR) repeat protein
MTTVIFVHGTAEPLLIQASSMTKCLLGDEHPDVAQSLNNLALLYKSQGRYSDAEPLYIEALANHPNTITIRKNLEYLRRNRQP